MNVSTCKPKPSGSGYISMHVLLFSMVYG